MPGNKDLTALFFPFLPARENLGPVSPEQLNTVGNHLHKPIPVSSCPGYVSDCRRFPPAAFSLCTSSAGLCVHAHSSALPHLGIRFVPILGTAADFTTSSVLTHQIFMEHLPHLGCTWDLRTGGSSPFVATSSVSLRKIL